MAYFAVLLACPSALWPIVDLVVLLLVVLESLAAFTAAGISRASGKNVSFSLSPVSTRCRDVLESHSKRKHAPNNPQTRMTA